MKKLLYNKPMQVALDAGICAFAWFAAYLIRFGGEIPAHARAQMLTLLAPVMVVQIAVNGLAGVYKLQWRYVSGADALYVGRAYLMLGVLLTAASLVLGSRVPLLNVEITIIGTLMVLSAMGALALRLARRLVYLRNYSSRRSLGVERRFLIVGAGAHGATVAREMGLTKGIEVVGFVDDDPHKQGAIIAGVKVLGQAADLPRIVESYKVDEILVCITPKSRRSWHMTDVATSDGKSVPSRIVPTLEDILSDSGIAHVVAGPIQTRPKTPTPLVTAPHIATLAKLPSNGNGNSGNGKGHLVQVTKSAAPKASGAIVPRLRNKTILITGGAGFIGSSLAALLVEDNQVILLDQGFARAPIQYTSLLQNRNVTTIEGSILHMDLASIVKRADIVVHAAAILGVSRVCSAGRETLETNYVGTSRLLKATEASTQLERFVYFSTSEVFGVNSYRVAEGTNASVGPIAESRWSYAMSKLAGEHLVASYYREIGLPIAIVRPFNIFGPRRTGDYALRRFILRALAGEPLEVHGDGTQIRSWCYIDDFCTALLQMMSVPAAVGEDFNIGHPGNILTMYELAKKVIQFCDSSSAIVFRESPFPDISIRVPSLEKARRLLGYEPKCDLNAGLRLTIQWYRENLLDFPILLSSDTAPKQVAA